ncbi:unnamed protein product [Cercospora beticola]|nr:unnamed protein product [Cercospora beticola]
MRFTVHIMPPPRRQWPPDAIDDTPPALKTSTSPATASVTPLVALEKLAVPVEPTSTFASLWKESEQRFRSMRKDGMAGMYFSHLQNLEGGKITMTDTIESMYEEGTPASERQLFIYTDYIDRPSAVSGSTGIPFQGHKKRPHADASNAQQATFKRRRMESTHRGAPLKQGDAETAGSSRGAGDEDVLEAGAKSTAHVPDRPRTEIANNTGSSGTVDQEREDATQRRSLDSTQKSPLSPQSPVTKTGSKQTPPQNAFRRLERRQHASGKGRPKSTWSPAEDKILKQGMRGNWNSMRISQALASFGRSDNAVRGRIRLLLAKDPSLRGSTQSRDVTPRWNSSPPLATGSTVIPSSPCEVNAIPAPTSTPNIIAYVQLPDPPVPAEDGPQIAAQIVPESQLVSGQTATPPTSNSSEKSGKLRAPAHRMSNASRLRKSRNHAQSARTSKVSGSGSVDADKPSVIKCTPEQAFKPVDNSSRSLENSECAERSSAIAGLPSHSDGGGLETRDDSRREVSVTHAETLANHVSASQPKADVTIPPRKQGGATQRRKDKARWREALALAKGQRAEAEHIFMMNLNKEAMLEAVSVEDEAEIQRLKAQRRRLERELALQKGVAPPKRRVPPSFSCAQDSRPHLEEEADEVVIREDGWSTDEEENGPEMPDDFEDSDVYDETASVSALDDEFEVVDVDVKGVEGPRIVELTPTPPPSIAVAEEHAKPKSKKNRTKTAKSSARKATQAQAQNTSRPSITPADARLAASKPTMSRKATASRKASIPASDVAARSRASSELSRNPPNTPHRKLTHDQVVAAHLAECKRKEALWLNDDDDGDSDDDSEASSS